MTNSDLENLLVPIRMREPAQSSVRWARRTLSGHRSRISWMLVGWTLAMVLQGFGSGATATFAVQIGPSRIGLIDGTSIDGEIKSIDRNLNVIGSGIPTGLKFGDVLSVRTDRQIQASPENKVSIYPIDGGQLMVANPSVSNENAAFQSAAGPAGMPLQSIRAIVWSHSPGVANAIKQPSNENDQVVVDTPDGERIVEGILEKIDASHVHVNYKGESRKIGLAKIKAVVTADLGLPKLSGSLATIRLIDGSHLVGVIAELVDGKLNVGLVGGADLQLDTGLIANVSIASDRILYLSDTEPVDVQERSVFAIQRPWMRDRSVENNPLRIRWGEELEFSKGLGTQAFCRLEFDNERQFDRFTAIVGIDVETLGRGDCQVLVRGDGIELWAKRIRATDEPQKLDVDITGFKRIALIVQPGEEFDLGDHVDWCEARFLKTK